MSNRVIELLALMNELNLEDIVDLDMYVDAYPESELNKLYKSLSKDEYCELIESSDK